MSRRVVNITLDNLDDLPIRCRRCVFWELDPVARARAEEAGDTAFEKEAWVSGTLLDWGSCGKLVYVDGIPAGYMMFAPAPYVPRSIAFPTSPVSADAVLLMTARVMSEFSGGGLGRMLMEKALILCRERFPLRPVALGAQVPLVPFYERFGFAAASEPYDDFGVAHVEMVLRLPG